MEVKDFNFITHGDDAQRKRHKKFAELLKNCPIPDNEILLNMGLFLVPQTLSRILFMDFLYRQILTVQGVVVDFGTRWGQNLSLFSAMRGIYEPYNRLRKIVGFDTFEGFPCPSGQDSKSRMMVEKSYSVTSGYLDYLSNMLDIQEHENPLSHIKKYDKCYGYMNNSYSQKLGQ